MELQKCIPCRFTEEKTISATKDRFTFSKGIAKKIKWKYCRVYHANVENGTIVLFEFTDRKDNDTFKVCVNKANGIVRICATKLANKLNGKKTDKYVWLENVLIVLFK